MKFKSLILISLIKKKIMTNFVSIGNENHGYGGERDGLTEVCSLSQIVIE
jgi:hypothetical protein